MCLFQAENICLFFIPYCFHFVLNIPTASHLKAFHLWKPTFPSQPTWAYFLALSPALGIINKTATHCSCSILPYYPTLLSSHKEVFEGMPPSYHFFFFLGFWILKKCKQGQKCQKIRGSSVPSDSKHVSKCSKCWKLSSQLTKDADTMKLIYQDCNNTYIKMNAKGNNNN